MVENPLQIIGSLGQSLWLDYIERDMLVNGRLSRYINEDGIVGQTSNPAIFEKAISGSSAYDEILRGAVADGNDAVGGYRAVVFADVGDAADIFREIWLSTGGGDGYVSLEVSPHLARDTEGTKNRAREFWQILDRPNVMIKVPATVEGLPAIRQLTAEGININVTLLFSIERYVDVAEAYIQGLEDRLSVGESLENVSSVASFFLSRIDALVDPELEDRAPDLLGEVAISSARIAYQEFKRLFSGERWERLAAAGARVQRLLWASTSTKNPEYSDVKYVEALIGPQTVNTLPVKTLEAYRDHGEPSVRLEEDVDRAREVIAALPDHGVDLQAMTDELERQGLAKFEQPFDRLLETIKQRMSSLAA